MQKNITISGKEYTMKHCVRARIIFETITGKIWTLATLTDQYNYMYSAILAGTPDATLEYNAFLDALDENPALVATYQEFMQEALQAEARFIPKGKEDKGEGKN